MAKTEYFYGVHSVESLLELEPERVLTLFALKGRDDQRLKRVLELAEPFGISVQQASRDKLEKLAGQPFHQGVVAAVRAHPTLNEKDLDALLNEKPQALLLALDHITDPHNLGAIIRTANLAGAHGVIIPKRRAVGLTATVAKTSAGALNYTPVAKVTNIAKTIEDLKKDGMWFMDTGNDGWYRSVKWLKLL